MSAKRPDDARDRDDNRARDRNGTGAVAAPSGLDRRTVLAGLAGLGATFGCASVNLAGPFKKATRDTLGAFTKVDVHCHTFNGSDLPIGGFLQHQIPVVGPRLAGQSAQLHALIDRFSPSAADELKDSERLLTAAEPVGPGQPKEAKAVAVWLGEQAGKVGDWDLLSGRDVSGTTARVADMLTFICQARYQIAAACVQTYQSIDLFTPSLIDYDNWSDDHAETPFEEQIGVHERVAKLSILGKIGRRDARVHPFTSFDPLREVRRAIDPDEVAHRAYSPFGDATPAAGKTLDPLKLPPLPAVPTPPPPPDVAAKPWALRTTVIPPGSSALTIVRHSIERAGFVGVKVYPAVGFLPLGNECWDVHKRSGLGAKLDAALRALFAYCEACEVPVMTHASNSNGYALGYGLIGSPAAWAPVLREFPRLRLNLGHFGHLEGFDKDRGLKSCEAWIRQAAVLMQRYENVYADLSNSALPVVAGFADEYLPLLKRVIEIYPRTRLRLMYGSDFWVNRVGPNADADVDAFSELLPGAFEKDLVACVMGGNALRFLGLLDDKGGKPEKNQNRLRLQQFYADQIKPAWL